MNKGIISMPAPADFALPCRKAGEAPIALAVKKGNGESHRTGKNRIRNFTTIVMKITGGIV
jgi:hypothetical protein